MVDHGHLVLACGGLRLAMAGQTPWPPRVGHGPATGGHGQSGRWPIELAAPNPLANICFFDMFFGLER